jgi:hypothetical protein
MVELLKVQRKFRIFRNVLGGWVYQLAEEDRPGGKLRFYTALHPLAEQLSCLTEDQVREYLEKAVPPSIWGIAEGFSVKTGRYRRLVKLSSSHLVSGGGDPSGLQGPWWGRRPLRPSDPEWPA